MLDYVNNYFPDILPQSVLKHYGYSSRPEGNIGESALFSRDVDYAEGVLIKSAYINKKEDDMSFKTGTVKHGAPSDISSSIYSLLNKLQNVNNNDTKLSRDVNIDEFDERDYNVINTTGLRGYASLKHEVMTWDDIKYLNQVRCVSIEDRFYLYKILDNETMDIIIYKAKKKTRSEYNAIRRAYGRGFNGNTVSISELIKSNRNSGNDNSDIFRYEQEKFNNNDKFDNQKIRAKRESNGRGIAENGNNDNLSEEKYSRDVDYAEYAELKRQNKQLKEINEVLKHQFELTNGREVSIKAC